MRMQATTFLVALSIGGVLFAGCSRESDTSPPTVHYGQDPCDVCKMIISEQRYAAALVVDDDGYIEKLTFDDIGCMLDARDHARGTILAAYVNDYNDKEWIDAEQAVYVYSNDLHTPMAFGVASFRSGTDAEKLQQNYDGELLTFDEVNERFLAGELTISPGEDAPGPGSMGRDVQEARDSYKRQTIKSQYATKQCTLSDVDGDVIVALTAPQSPKVGKQPIAFLVLHGSNQNALRPLEDCILTIEPAMPYMGHGSSGNENPQRTDEALHRGLVNFTMPGEWIVHVTIEHGTSTATVDFAFEVTK